jgi:hypothetical protein
LQIVIERDLRLKRQIGFVHLPEGPSPAIDSKC